MGVFTRPEADATSVNLMMKTFLVLVFTLTGSHCQVLSGPGVVTGLVKKTVTIPCRYNKQHSYSVKYWCKGMLQSHCVKMASTDGSVTAAGSRVSIQDKKPEGVFYINITSLTTEDKGWYQCAIHRSVFYEDYSHHIYLNVSVGDESDSDAVVPTAGGLQPSPAAKPVTSDSSAAGVWGVIRWVFFTLMLACFLTVTWWKWSASSESVAIPSHTLQRSDSTHSHV